MQIRLYLFLLLSPLSPLRASLFITTIRFRNSDPSRFVYSIHDSTEAAIQKMIEGAQRMIRVNNNSQEEEQPEIPINPATKRDELEIKTLQNAPRDEGKLIELLKLKER